MGIYPKMEVSPAEDKKSMKSLLLTESITVKIICIRQPVALLRIKRGEEKNFPNSLRSRADLTELTFSSFSTYFVFDACFLPAVIVTKLFEMI